MDGIASVEVDVQHKRADTQDPEVKKLAEAIIKAQKKEIEEMKRMIERSKDK